MLAACAFGVGAIAVVSVVTPGCGGDDGPPPPVPLADLPTAIATASCAAVARCLGGWLDAFVAGGDCVTPLEKTLSNAVLPAVEASIAAGRIVYHPERVPACTAALSRRTCAALDDRFPTECEAAIEGTVALGGPCTIDLDCAGSAACVSPPGGGCPGTCTARSGVGRTCARDDECEGGLVCQRTLCTAPATEGQACEGPTAPRCTSGLVCLGGNATRQGTCRTLASLSTAAQGARCDVDEGPLCSGDLSCAVTSITPVAATCEPPAAAGMACRVGLPDPCPATDYCDGTLLTSGMGTCRPLPRDGAACATRLVGPTCAAGQVCLGGVCRPVQDNGGACTEAAGCYSGRCSSGVCMAPALCAL